MKSCFDVAGPWDEHGINGQPPWGGRVNEVLP